MLEISTEDFTIGELQSCIKSLSNNKAPGLDQILPEVWKSGASTPALLEICNKAMNCDVPKAWTKSCMALTPEQLEICNKVMNGDVFKVWTKSCIVPLPKKGDLGITSNYRGISLTIIAAKINNRLLSNRLRLMSVFALAIANYVHSLNHNAYFSLWQYFSLIFGSRTSFDLKVLMTTKTTKVSPMKKQLEKEKACCNVRKRILRGTNENGQRRHDIFQCK